MTRGFLRRDRPTIPKANAATAETTRLVTLLREAACAFHGPTRRIVAWNGHAQALFGLDATQAQDVTIDALLAAPAALDTDAEHPNPCSMRRSDGRLFAAQVTCSPLDLDAREILLIVRPEAQPAEPAAARPASSPPEASMAERDALLRSVFEHAATGIVLTDLQGQIIECNAAFQKLVGFKQRELRHLTLEALSHPEDREAEGARFRRLLAGDQEFFDLTKRFIRKDGAVIWAQATASLVTDASSQPLYCIEMVNDITELRRQGQRAEIQLTMSRILAENPPANMALVQVMQAICKALDWQIGEYWTPEENQARLRRQVSWQVPGFNAAEFNLFGQHFAMNAGEGLPGRVWGERQPAWISDVLRDSNFLRRRMAEQAGIKGALAFPVQSSLGPQGVMVFAYRDFRQPDESLLAMLTDFGAQLGQFLVRKQAEKHLKLLGAIVNSAGEAIIGMDADGRITSWNPSAEELFGFSLQEAMTRSSLALFAPEHAAALRAAMDTAQRGGPLARMKAIALTKEGLARPVYLRLAPLADDEGRLSGLSMTVFKATDR